MAGRQASCNSSGRQAASKHCYSNGTAVAVVVVIVVDAVAAVVVVVEAEVVIDFVNDGRKNGESQTSLIFEFLQKIGFYLVGVGLDEVEVVAVKHDANGGRHVRGDHPSESPNFFVAASKVSMKKSAAAQFCRSGFYLIGQKS